MYMSYVVLESSCNAGGDTAWTPMSWNVARPTLDRFSISNCHWFTGNWVEMRKELGFDM